MEIIILLQCVLWSLFSQTALKVTFWMCHVTGMIDFSYILKCTTSYLSINIDHTLQRQIPIFITGHGVGEDALPFLIRTRSLQPDYRNNPLKTALKPPRAKAATPAQIQLRCMMKENQKSADKLRSTQEAETRGLLARPIAWIEWTWTAELQGTTKGWQKKWLLQVEEWRTRIGLLNGGMQ